MLLPLLPSAEDEVQSKNSVGFMRSPGGVGISGSGPKTRQTLTEEGLCPYLTAIWRQAVGIITESL